MNCKDLEFLFYTPFHSVYFHRETLEGLAFLKHDSLNIGKYKHWFIKEVKNFGTFIYSDIGKEWIHIKDYQKAKREGLF